MFAIYQKKRVTGELQIKAIYLRHFQKVRELDKSKMGGRCKKRGSGFGSYKDSITLHQSLAIQGRAEEFEESNSLDSDRRAQFSEATSREIDDEFDNYVDDLVLIGFR